MIHKLELNLGKNHTVSPFLLIKKKFGTANKQQEEIKSQEKEELKKEDEGQKKEKKVKASVPT